MGPYQNILHFLFAMRKIFSYKKNGVCALIIIYINNKEDDWKFIQVIHIQLTKALVQEMLLGGIGGQKRELSREQRAYNYI